MSHQLVHLMMTQGWQIAVLAAIVAMMTRMMARRRPHLAHGLWMLVLIKCVTPPIWGHSLGLFSWLPAAAFETADLLRATGRVVLARPAYQADWPMPHADAESDIPATGNPAGSSNASDTRNTTLSNLDIAAERGYGRLSGRKSESAALSGPAGWRRISWYQGVLALVWSGAMVTAVLMVVRYLRCLRLIHRRRTNEFDAMLDERLRSLTKRLGLRRIPRVIVSDERFGPAVLGLLRQTIVLPRCLLAAPGGSDLPGEQNVGYLDAILAHELIHIRRGDLYTGTLQAVAQSLWWFHPAVWICNRGLSRESERCCDEQVIAELGCSPAQYARSLLAVIESRHRLQPVPVFPGMKPVEITTQRMERIMSLRNGLRKRTPIGYWVVVAALAIVVLPGAMAKPQTDEEVPTEIPNAASDPGRTADVAAPPIQVSTRTYDVGDLVARLAEDRSQSPEQARTNLLKMLDVLVSPELEFVPELPGLPATSMPAAAVPAAPMPTTAMPALPSIRRISNARMIRKRSSLAMHADRLIVIHSDAGHRELQNHIARIREFGFTPFEITSRCFRGPVDRMHSLMSSFGLEAPLVEAEAANPTSYPQSPPTHHGRT
jgi:beta-lactamase regulating signal transducer with metallopeptidase domain